MFEGKIEELIKSLEPRKVIFEKTHPDAKLPTKATEGSACYDVYSVEDAVVEFGKITIVNLGFKVKIPAGYEIVVRPRSGLAFKQGITIVNAPGTIDEDYRGEVKVALSSLLEIPDNHIFIAKGGRVAQIALKKVETYEFVEGKVDEDTQRGVGGFGSTGN